MFKHYIWDFDGTLFNSYPPMVKAYFEALKEEGIYMSEEAILRHMKISVKDLMAYTNERYDIGSSFSDRFAKLRAQYEAQLFEPYAEVVDVLKVICRSGHKNYVYTHLGGSTHGYLEQHDMAQYFEEVVTSENAFARKPDPEAINYIIETYKIAPDTCVVIGDRNLDIQSGQNAGIKACFYSERPDYTCDVADYVVTDFKDILTLK